MAPGRVLSRLQTPTQAECVSQNLYRVPQNLYRVPQNLYRVTLSLYRALRGQTYRSAGGLPGLCTGTRPYRNSAPVPRPRTV